MAETVVLMILDGWGLAPDCADNAACQAHTPTLDKLQRTAPHGELLCTGESVGLPEGQQGNSEVGHLNLGAGRVVYQDLMRINRDIAKDTLKNNSVLKEFLLGCKTRKGTLHLMGLLSDGGVHSHQDHLLALLSLAQQEGITHVVVHVFTDGRDVPPSSGLAYVQELEENLASRGIGRIGSISGRYYAMDRDKRWERVEKAWRAIVLGEGAQAANASAALEASYEAGVTDEFVVPTVIAGENPGIQPEDGVLFFNFRADRARELTEAMALRDFEGFERGGYLPAHVATLTEYDAALSSSVQVVYPPEELPNTLGSWLAQKNKRQMRIAETEKYAHVTFFFNGGVEPPYAGEARTLIPSPKVATYDLQPEMSAPAVAEAVVTALQTKQYAFILVNFANPDMVGHTGILEAAIGAMEAVDTAVSRVVQELDVQGATLLLTADHGNCECMRGPDGTPYTAHTTNPVPVILYGDPQGRRLRNGRLSDIAPTVLDLLEIQAPKEMTGQSLLIQREEKYE